MDKTVITQGECHVEMKAEIRETPQKTRHPEDCQQPPEAWGSPGQILPHDPQSGDLPNSS